MGSRIKLEVLSTNPDSAQDIFNPRVWDLREFLKPNRPVVVGTVGSPEQFSQPNGIRVLDMPIKMPGQGWKVPDRLCQFLPVIEQVARHERLMNPNIDDFYCYVTIDQKIVEPQTSQRRPGWHTDAFVTDSTGVQIDVLPENMSQLGYKVGEEAERTYVVADCLPTAFLEGPFDILNIADDEHGEVGATFEQLAQGKPPFSFPPYTIIRLDPFVVHTAVPNKTDKPMARTFIKIAFSKYQYNREGNTHNDQFDYSWPMIPRTPGARQHRNGILGIIREGHEAFQAVDPSILFREDVDLGTIEWIKPEIRYIQKQEKVSIRQAFVGEEIITRSGDFVISKNFAPKNAVALTNPRGQSYCITRDKFDLHYQSEPDQEGLYTPVQMPKKVVMVTRDVKMYCAWGGMQYVKAGSALVINNRYHIHGIHPDDLEAAYSFVPSESRY